MAEPVITTVYISASIGDDDTGKPIQSGQPIFYFRTLDGALAKLETYPTYDILSVIVIDGDIEMNDVQYENIVFGYESVNARLLINGRKGDSIRLINIILDIDTQINIPADPISEPGQEDEPVIVANSLIMVEGHRLDIIDQIGNPSIPNITRDIIRSETLLVIENSSGIVDLRNRSCTVYNSIICPINAIGGFDEIRMLAPSTLLKMDIDTSLLNVIDFPTGNNILKPYVNETSIKLMKAKGTTGLIQEPVRFLSTILIDTSTITIDVDEETVNQLVNKDQLPTGLLVFILTLKTLASAIVPISLLEGRSSGTTKLSDRNARRLDFIKKYKNNPRVSKFLKALQEDENPSIDITGNVFRNMLPLSIQAAVIDGIENILNPEIVSINTISLENAEVILDDQVIQKFAESTGPNINYNNKYMSNSYNNNGSIFRVPKIITSDYTQDKFDGNVFMVNAGTNNILITVPIDALENRLFNYIRTDNTGNTVIIQTSDDNSFKLKNKCKNKSTGLYRKNGHLELYGFDSKLWKK
jgi:hypothetical protein